MKKTPPRLSALALVVLLSLAPIVSAIVRPISRAATQNLHGEVKKKKRPPGASGYEQFAGRDASDKLITGAATRRHSPGIMGGLKKSPPTERQAAISEAEKQYAAGNFEAAVAAYQQAIKLTTAASSSDNGDLQYALGKVYSDMERYEDAANAFQTAAARRPSGEIALYATYELGNAQLDLGNYAEAIKAYEKTLEVLSGEWKTSRPQLSAQYLPYPHYNIGLAHLGLKQKEQALTDFERVIQLKPDFAEAHFNLGLTLWQLGRSDAATAQQTKLKTLNPELADKLAALFK